MACSCTEDFFTGEGTPLGTFTMPARPTHQGTIIGRNKVTCQECADAFAAQKVKMDAQREEQAIRQEALDAIITDKIDKTPELKARKDAVDLILKA